MSKGMLSAFEELGESRSLLISHFSEGNISEDFQENYTEIIDQYFRRSLQESEIGTTLFKKKRTFALVAIGGYGRRELCLHSDIDIMVLFCSKIPVEAKKLSNELFFPLWDLSIEPGYAIRSVKDCLILCKNDFQVLTSIMDARFICGDSPLFLSLMENLHEKVIAKKISTFGKWLADQDKIRMDNFGDAGYLLEPNLKEGIGGLRDYHHILWLSRALFHLGVPRDLEYLGKLTHNEYQGLRKNLKFIWFVRNHLHYLSGRENDRLNFEYQEEIARLLGFKDKQNLIAVEQFLGKLHACMISIKSLHRSFTKSHHPIKRGIKKDLPSKGISEGLFVYHDEINFDTATAIISNPHLILKIFEQSALCGYDLSIEAMRLVREFLYIVNDDLKGAKESIQSFLNILNAAYTPKALDQMFETGLLDAFIPEFGQIRDRVLFDTYHIFPVGRHVLETIRYLKSLFNQNDILLMEIFSDLSNPERLFLSGLFHDIGRAGKDHARRGSAITGKILKRFGYEKKGAKDIQFLVKHHLLLVETATRRDLNDEKAVLQCARTVGDVELLKMLYLLTWADSKATGPGAWNKWIANLVRELFFKITHILERGELASPQASQKVKETKSEIRRFTADRIDPSNLERLFEVMSPRYLINTSPHDIVDHLEMVRWLTERLDDKETTTFSLVDRENESEGCWELTFLAKDRPGLFSDLAGVLALNNINVLSAHIYTWRDGTAVDIFRVSSPPDPLHPNKIWKKVRMDLNSILRGEFSLACRLDRKSEPSILSSRSSPSRPPQVRVDNKSSDFFTLIEIFADDRIGLLYLITRSLFDLRLDIRIAKIATKADQVADIFYVCDLEGQKVEDEERVKEIKNALLLNLAPLRSATRPP